MIDRSTDRPPRNEATTMGTVKERSSRELDARQDRFMALTSSDGRPPSRGLRLKEWRWLGVAAFVLLGGLALWISIEGVSSGAVIAGVAIAAMLLLGATPVLGAGLMRGSEERSAYRKARTERRHHHAR